MTIRETIQKRKPTVWFMIKTTKEKQISILKMENSYEPNKWLKKSYINGYKYIKSNLHKKIDKWAIKMGVFEYLRIIKH